MPNPASRALRRAVAVALVAAVAHAGALGADKKAAAAPAAGAKTPILTPEQLRDCMTRKDKLAKETDAVVQAKAAVAADQAEIAKMGAALEEQGATLDRTSEEAVASYNARIVEHNGRVEAWKAKANAFNTEAEAFLASKDSFEKACANRRYDDRDLSDLQKKK